MKVLHYKSNFLNASETFIQRLIDNHRQAQPVALCYRPKQLSPSCPLFSPPEHGLRGLLNTGSFHLNRTLPFYRSVVRNEHPDLIHAHFGFDGYRMIGLAREARCPLLVSFYGSDVARLPGELDWKRRYRKLAQAADAFIAVSDLMKSELVNLGFPASKIEVIRFGIDLDHFTMTPGYQADAPLMMVGRMVEKKGFTHALEAVRILKEAGHPLQLDLYGDGPLRAALEQQAAESGIARQVHFHGFQPVRQVRSAFAGHSALLVPSVTATDGDREGLPNTLLEGMARGIPVITSRHAAIPEAVTHEVSGLLTPEGDAEALATAIRRLKEGAVDVGKLRNQARSKIERHYSLGRMVEQTEALYGQLLSPPSPPSSR